MESPSPNTAPAGAPAATDEFWAFNPQQPPPMTPAGGDDTSLDELLALYQTAQDAPAAAPFAPMGEPDSYPGFPAFGGDAAAAPGGFGFGDPATDQPFPTFDAPPPGGDAFGGFDFNAPAFGAEPAATAPDLGFGAPGADPFAMPAGDPFGGAPAAHPEADFSFGGDAGALPDLAPPTADAPPFGMEAAADTSFGFDAPAADAFAAPAGGADAFGGVDPFAGADPFAAPPPGAPAEAGGLDDLFGGDAGPVFPAFDEPAAAAPAAPAEELQEFVPDDSAPLFPAMDEGPVFPAVDAAPAATPAAPEEDLFGGDAGPVFPALDEGGPVFAAFDETPAAPAAAAPEDDLFGGDMGPVFPAFDEPAAATPAATPAPAVSEGLDDLFGGDLGPVFPAVEETPAAAIDFTQAFPEAAPAKPAEPVVAEVPKAEPAPVAAVTDPDATLRFKEVPARAETPLPAIDPAALAAMTGREVTIRTADDRKSANQQLSQVVSSMTGQLDDLQGKLANLYAELQRAAVRRASVGEINDITAELGRTRAQLAEGSDVYKQVMYMRQVADAYLALIQEL